MFFMFLLIHVYDFVPKIMQHNVLHDSAKTTRSKKSLGLELWPKKLSANHIDRFFQI